MENDAIIGCVCIVIFALLASKRRSLISVFSVVSFGYLVYQFRIKDNIQNKPDVLTSALSSFKRLRAIDIGDHDAIVRNMTQFEEIYKHVLLGHLNYEYQTQIGILLDIRRDTLNLLYGYFIKTGTGTSLDSDFRKAIDDVSASTYRMINILKAKYKIRGSLFPNGYNQSSIHEIL